MSFQNGTPSSLFQRLQMEQLLDAAQPNSEAVESRRNRLRAIWRFGDDRPKAVVIL